MESLLFSERLLAYLNKYQDIDVKRKRALAKGTLEIVGNFLYDFSVPSSWQLKEIERRGNSVLVFHWTTETGQATCPECKTLSTEKARLYLIREIQDLPIAGMTVFHSLKAARYRCNDPECPSNTFIEQFFEFADKDARLSNRLKDFVVRQAMESSCHGTSKSLAKIGIRVSTDTINREVKKKGAIAVFENLSRDDVEVLAIDDINLRKGNSSTACSVFIDADTHRVLVIVQGTTSEIAEKVIRQYPSATIVSRDRGTAYAAAASNSGKMQVADGFHLVQNIHKTVKDVLSMEVAHDLFVREGDGWITMVDSAHEEPDHDESDNDEGLVVIKPATLEVEDIERRINFAGLTELKATKYKKTLEILELTEGGLRTSEIAKRLSMKPSDIRNYRKNAPETIENVEIKIDEYYKIQEHDQWKYHQKTIVRTARPSSESIVEPYKDTVLGMFKEGKNHRHIHPVIVKEGFQGSANAVYQYLIKYTRENDIAFGRKAKAIPPEEANDFTMASRPPRISIERTSRHTLYQCLLHVAATRKAQLQQALLGVGGTTNDIQNEDHQNTPVEWVNNSSYTDSVAKIVFDTATKDKSEKKTQ